MNSRLDGTGAGGSRRLLLSVSWGISRFAASLAWFFFSATMFCRRGQSVAAVGDRNEPQMAVNNEPPACTVEQLVGHSGAHQPGGWVIATNETRPSYGCSCPYFKARYFCPHLSEKQHHYVWQPHSVAGGECTPTAVTLLMEDLFPPGFTTFIFGNSHLRQPMEALMCQFSDQIVTRNASVMTSSGESKQQLIGLDEQCRGFSHQGHDDLLNKCFDAQTSFLLRCSDDMASFQFRNGASLHYRFSDQTLHHKDIDNEIAYMGLNPDKVDVVIANMGNGEIIPFSSLSKSARRMQESGKLILWLSTFYNGRVGIYAGPRGKALADLGVVQFDFSMMMRDSLQAVKELSCKVVENRSQDTHYCMPGPPDELGILLARMVWAHFVQQQKVSQ